MEKLKGTEALQQLSLRDIAVDEKTALDTLTQKTREVFKVNVEDALLHHLDTAHPDYEEIKQQFQQMADNPERFVPSGGLSFSKSELNYVYTRLGRLSFDDVLGSLARDVLPKFFRPPQSRNPGIVSVGYILDLMRIVDPKIAQFDDGAQALIRSMRKTNYAIKPFLLGSMIDDTKNLRGTADFPIDFLADREGATQLETSYMTFANGSEQVDFQRGLEIDLDEIKRLVYGNNLH